MSLRGMKDNSVIMKTLKVLLSLFLIFVIGSGASSCSNDDDSPKTPSLIGTWECYDPNLDNSVYPYFIVEGDHCYFCKTSSLNSWGEKYKYVYNETTKILTVWQWYEGGANDGYDSEPEDFVWSIVKLTSDELWFEIKYETNGDLFKFKKVK